MTQAILVALSPSFSHYKEVTGGHVHIGWAFCGLTCLSAMGASVDLRYLPLTSLVILYTCVCSPLTAASSASLARSSM